MPNDPLTNAFERISKLETRNRLRGGHDYPAIIGYWILNSQTAGATPAYAETNQTSGAFPLYYCVLPMQNPKMAFRFRFKNASSSTTSWALTEQSTGTMLGTGSAAGTTPTGVELHLDMSQFFTYGQLGQYNLTCWTNNGANAAQIQAEYVGGSWIPDTAVAP